MSRSMVMVWLNSILWRWIWEQIFKNGNPIEKDELCTPWWICKVEQAWEYDYKVLSKREDLKNVWNE